LSQSLKDPWWKSAVIYQVYHRSFQDSDGDGIGDLRGLIRRLDYFVRLGVDAIWLSPIYPSPMVDFGYDVTDYCGVDSTYGTLEAFDRLVSETHSRGLRLVLDYVPNHTSRLHPWFLESRSSRQAAKRDWYVWRDGNAQGGPPNNWRDSAHHSAWTWDDQT
jgi:alpha-glucosidase